MKPLDLILQWVAGSLVFRLVYMDKEILYSADSKAETLKTSKFKSQIFALSINRFQRNAWRQLFCCRSQDSQVQSSQLWDQRKFSWEFSDRRRRTLRLWGELSFPELHIKCHHHPKWLNWKIQNVQGLLGCIFSLRFYFLFASSFSPSQTFVEELFLCFSMDLSVLCGW